MQFNFQTHAFSRRGAWLIVKQGEHGRLLIKTLRGSVIARKEHAHGWAADYYEIALFDQERELAFEVEADSCALHLHAVGVEARLVFLDDLTLGLYVRGGELRLLPKQDNSWLAQLSADEWLLCSQLAGTYHHFRSGPDTELQLLGEATVTGHWGRGAQQRRVLRVQPTTADWASLAFRESLYQLSQLPQPPAWSTAQDQAVDDEASWMQACPEVASDWQQAAREAWRLLGSWQVSPSDRLRRRALLSSKNSWLIKVWSWDNCFHALALAHVDPDLALDQLRMFFDLQAPNGAIPGTVNDQRGTYGFCKPPVFGWCLRELRRLLGDQRCSKTTADMYEPLARYTRYWLDYHRHPADASGLCFYRHGNDSGWDNGGPFTPGELVRTPDLDAYLIVQMQELAYLATACGKTDEATRWQDLAAEHRQRFIDNMFVYNQPVSRRIPDGAIIPATPTCALSLIPLILGEQLPAAIRAHLIDAVRPDGPFLTPYGVASEQIGSPRYQRDGYWRGPIWAPVQVLLHAGLRDCGEHGLARELATRCCRMWAEHPSFSENHDAESGAGLQAPGVSWTAAAFIHLATALVDER
ncbi:MAG: amylo-alpha-1,6-glucosidase [Planctomycetota bacterium]